MFFSCCLSAEPCTALERLHLLQIADFPIHSEGRSPYLSVVVFRQRKPKPLFGQLCPYQKIAFQVALEAQLLSPLYVISV